MVDILQYLPFIIADLEEYQKICRAENPEFEGLNTTTETWLKNKYPTEADLDGIQIWEEILKLKPLSTDTLEDRRVRVLAKLNERLPYDRIRLYKMMAAICGWDGFELTLEDAVLTVILAMETGSQLQSVKDMLLEVVPANILIQIEQTVRNYMGLTAAAGTIDIIDLAVLPRQMGHQLEVDGDLTATTASMDVTDLSILPRQKDKILDAQAAAQMILVTYYSSNLIVKVRDKENA